MNIKAFLFDDDRGVSPVIGVILMVAITVILAAVIAAFVLGLGDTNSSTPNVTWEYDYNGSSSNATVEVTMTGGDSFDPARVSVTGERLEGSSPSTGSNTLGEGDSVDNALSDTVTAGDSFVVALTEPSSNAPDDFELDLIFESEDGGTSSTIGGTTGPDA
jgi:flagellin-like protein